MIRKIMLYIMKSATQFWLENLRNMIFMRHKHRKEDDFEVNYREIKDVNVWSGFTCYRSECSGGLWAFVTILLNLVL
jgi:hypothetical protein